MATPSLWSRFWARTNILIRATLGSIGVLRAAPPPPGISTGRVASPRHAEEDLASMATSPTVYAATQKRAWSLAMYPIKCLLGFGMGGKKPEQVDPDRVPWAASFFRLLQTPNPADLGELFPSATGEGLIAQITADLLLTGNAFVAVQVAKSGEITGLFRLHPQGMTLERGYQGERWLYRPGTGEVIYYPRRTVAHLKLLSWQRGGQAELGTGAGDCLRPLLQAERTALEQSAAVVEQGGVDVTITGKDAQTNAFLSVKANREEIARQATESLKGKDGRRVMVMQGGLEMKDSGLKPADIRAPEILTAARISELQALGCVPIAVGSDAGTFATAVQQYRVQAENDEALAGAIEAYFLRPLAQHFARRAGGRWAARADQVTARIDLSTHPGYGYLRTEQFNRMQLMVNMGWSSDQAAEAEGVDLPPPAGPPRPTAAPAPSNGPGGPVGDGPGARTLSQIFTRQDPAPAGPPAAPKAPENTHWRAVEDRREQADKGLQAASERQLQAELDRYWKILEPALKGAERSSSGMRARDYNNIDLAALFGPIESWSGDWVEALSPEWLDAWQRAAAAALEGIPQAGDVPVPEAVASDLATLEESAAEVADYSRTQVLEITQQGMDQGLSINEIQAMLQQSAGFTPERALRIARTESVRSESSGTLARYRAAETVGLKLEQEWMASPGARDSHKAMDGKRVPIDGEWTFPSGVKTRGPGLSGDPSEDINCRCAQKPVVVA